MSIGDFFKGLFGSSKRSEEEERLLQAIVENPDDDAPRLAYADYLTAQGNPYGEFVRVDVELEALPPDDPKRQPLDERWGELMSKYGKKWVKPLKELELQPLVVGHLFPSDWFERGVIEKITIDKRGVIPGKAERLWEIAPTIRRVHFERCSPMFDGIAGCELMSRVIVLDLSEVKFTPGDVATLLASPHLANLRELNLGDSSDGGELARLLAGCEQLENLRKLSLRSSDVDAEGLAALVGSPVCAKLTELDLAYCRIGNEGAAAIAGSPHVANLETLDLGHCDIGTEGAKSLGGSSHLAKLKQLNLESCEIGDEGAAALTGGAIAGSLESLDLGFAEVGDAGMQAIVAAPLFDGLKVLRVSGHEELGDAGITALAEAGDRSSLRELKISWAKCAADVLVKLVNSTTVRNVRKLDLSHTPFDLSVVEAIATSPQLENVEELSLYGDDDIDLAAAVDRFGEDAVYGG